MRKDRQVLLDILERIQLTAEFTEGSKEIFLQSRLVQEGVIRNLEIIGEATRNLSPELRDAHPEVPWRAIAAFRNVVIHHYWDIELERIWEVVEKEIPSLHEQILAILENLPGE